MKSITLLVETAVAPFKALFGKFGLLFIPTSGHTVVECFGNRMHVTP